MANNDLTLENVSKLMDTKLAKVEGKLAYMMDVKLTHLENELKVEIIQSRKELEKAIEVLRNDVKDYSDNIQGEVEKRLDKLEKHVFAGQI